MQKALDDEAKNITNEFTSLAYFIKTKKQETSQSLNVRYAKF